MQCGEWEFELIFGLLYFPINAQLVVSLIVAYGISKILNILEMQHNGNLFANFYTKHTNGKVSNHLAAVSGIILLSESVKMSGV